MNEIFLDTETTGLSVRDGDKIVEVACIETENLIPTKRVFHKFINPQKKISQEAFKIHGFSDDFLKEKEKFEDVADEFLEFIEGKKLIIHNAPFDISFLNNELKKANKKSLNEKEVVDTLSVARSKYPSSSNSLDNLCKRFNIDLSRRTKHNALLDCELLREVYINLIDQKEPTLSLNEIEEKKQDSKKGINTKKNSRIIIKPTEKEYISHRDFLKKEIKRNYF